MPAGYDDEERRREERRGREASDRYANREVFTNYEVGRVDDASDFDKTSADIPIWGWLTGSQDRVEQARDAIEADRNRQYWERLAQTAPTQAELTPEYYLESNVDEYGNLLMGPSELESMDPHRANRALEALGGIIDQGGYTTADRAASRQAAMAQGQQLRGNTEAILQQMGAQGMGGSGAELAARLGASQQYAMGNAMSDAMVQQAAMQRALQAMQGYGGLGTAMQGQEMSRRGQIDAYNQANMDWRRGRETRNTGTANRQQDARASGAQQAYQNREAAAAGVTNQYSADVANRNADANRKRQSDQAAAGVIGSVIGEIL